MNLVHGTAAEHIGTLLRACENNVTSVWSGSLRHNAYLRENLDYGVEAGLIKLKDYDHREAQESGYTITYTDKLKKLLGKKATA
jgi:hypothetical protein